MAMAWEIKILPTNQYSGLATLTADFCVLWKKNTGLDTALQVRYHIL